MRIEGRFVGHFAEDVRNAVVAKKIDGGLVVDLSGLSWADNNGEEVLLWLASLGCSFVPGNTYATYICEKLTLNVFQAAVNVAT